MLQPSWVRAALLFGLLIAALMMALGLITHAKAQSATAADKPFVVMYYKTKWGHADEFLALFKKNHYPLLKKQVEMGRMLKVSAVMPVYHHDGRRPLGLPRRCTRTPPLHMTGSILQRW